MARDRPSGTVTFLFTDIEDSTGLWEREPVAMQAALADHDRLTTAAFEDGAGHFIHAEQPDVVVDAITAT